MMIHVFNDENIQKPEKGKEALSINKVEAPSSIISSSSLSTSESSSRSYATSNTSELAQPRANAWKTVSPPKNGSVWDKKVTTPKASDEVQSIRRPRSIVDIIIAVEKAKADQTSQWRQTEHNANYSNGISSIVDAYDGPYLNSQRISKQNCVVRPSSSTYSSSQRSSSNPDTVTASQVLPPLPPPPRPNATKQEHHRYFYALRKATRLRKQMMNASNSPPQEIKRHGFQMSGSESSTSSSGGGGGSGSQHSRFRRYSESSNTDTKLPFMQHISNTNKQLSTVINPHSSQSTLFPVPPQTHNPIAMYQDDLHSPSYIAMKAWQNTSLASRPKRAYDPQFMLDILDSDDKETQELFLDLDATIRLQHAELGF
ncbi:uncharacterized protein FA14DRAFT_170829 [Meira miltonrushii]|uniref:Uncharacterized protein n=1 Tax=Meira miltonrushii TaxID=1280837 RepID=A0A316VLF3_9BASI|nr:uncharacterized protein FA14DRAFT_170829 [Meira miltonrushii]PWN38094.1 hypothetical protein FA14DRAFT_170829 [Meira miltonrushii]